MHSRDSQTNGDQRTFTEVLALLQHTVLSSVEFVEDYVQLRFNGPCLSAYIYPIIYTGGKAVKWGDSEYRNSIYNKIGRVIINASIDENALSFTFDDESKITIPLSEESYKGPEGFKFVDHTGQIWIV